MWRARFMLHRSQRPGADGGRATPFPLPFTYGPWWWRLWNVCSSLSPDDGGIHRRERIRSLMLPPKRRMSNFSESLEFRSSATPRESWGVVAHLPGCRAPASPGSQADRGQGGGSVAT